MDRYRALRFRRAVPPRRIDRIFFQRDQGSDLLQTFDVVLRMHPRIVSEAHVAPFEPCVGWRVDEAGDRPTIAAGLVLRLQRVAPIHEQHGLRLRDDGGSCRTGEPRQPCEPFGVGGKVFVPLCVRVGDDEGVRPLG